MKRLIVLLATVLLLSMCSCTTEDNDVTSGFVPDQLLEGHYVGVGEQGMIIEGDDGLTHTFKAGLGIDARYLKAGDYIRVEYTTEPLSDDGDEHGNMVYVDYITKIEMISEATDDINNRDS